MDNQDTETDNINTLLYSTDFNTYELNMEIVSNGYNLNNTWSYAFAKKGIPVTITEYQDANKGQVIYIPRKSPNIQ